MNKKTLEKVIDELKKDSPNIPYALGILETIMDFLPASPESVDIRALFKTTSTEPSQSEVDAKALDYMAKARLEETKKLAGDVQ